MTDSHVLHSSPISNSLYYHLTVLSVQCRAFSVPHYDQNHTELIVIIFLLLSYYVYYFS